jgi:hypothetical protein
VGHGVIVVRAGGWVRLCFVLRFDYSHSIDAHTAAASCVSFSHAESSYGGESAKEPVYSRNGKSTVLLVPLIVTTVYCGWLNQLMCGKVATRDRLHCRHVSQPKFSVVAVQVLGPPHRPLIR